MALTGFLVDRWPAKSGKWEIGRDGMIIPTNGQPFSGAHLFVIMWSRWDSEWYISVAKNGYQFTPAQPSSVTFFPSTHPQSVCSTASARGAAMRGGSSAEFCCRILSLLVALAYLHRLVRLERAAL